MKVDDRTSTSLSVSWKAPIYTGESPITLYTVEYRLSNETVFQQKNSTSLSVELINLLSAKRYDIRVFARNEHFIGERSTEISAKTGESGKP